MLQLVMWHLVVCHVCYSLGDITVCHAGTGLLILHTLAVSLCQGTGCSFTKRLLGVACKRIQLFIDLATLVSGPDAGSADGNEAVPGKALPPWLLRQGITSTSSAGGGQAGTPLLQAGVGANGAATSDEVILSEEEDQKRIEVCCWKLQNKQDDYSYKEASKLEC